MKNVKSVVFSVFFVASVFTGQVAQAKYIYTHKVTCEEAINAIEEVGYVDVPSVGNRLYYRFFSREILDSKYADLCAEARGEWRQYELLDANEELCTVPAVVCIDTKTARMPGKGWKSCNGVYHSGSRKSFWCPPKKK